VEALLLGLVFVAIVAVVGWRLRKARSAQPPQTPPAAGAPDRGQPGGPASMPALLPQAAEALRKPYEESAHPRDLEANVDFQVGLELLRGPGITREQLIGYCLGANHQIAIIAACALARRDDSGPATGPLLAYLRQTNLWTAYYILRFLMLRADRPVIAPVLLAARDWWPNNPLLPAILDEFIEARLAAGETPELTSALKRYPPDDIADVDAVLAQLENPLVAQLREELGRWRRERIDTTFLRTVGRIWGDEELQRHLVETPALKLGVELAAETLCRSPAASLLLVGEAGVGKTVLMRALAKRLAREGWTVFEASAIDVLAGQVYIGELEQRMRLLLTHLDADKRVLWYVPQFQELYYSGRHRFSPIGILDMVQPAVEAGRLRMVGEVRPAALEKVVQQRPRLRVTFKSLVLESASTQETVALAGAVAREELAPAGVSVEQPVLHEALELARNYITSSAPPGNVIDLLRLTSNRLAARGGPRAMAREDLLVTLSQLTGLPHSVLDEREGLDAAGLQAFFAQRVLGQPEAVRCLVDRVAMLKAGLTDPKRPIGVFLFAGPTGTGKTEVAKTLAEYLFGSAERMIRLDMSEFQEPQSLLRIIGESGEGGGTIALVDRIRKQPFSVVLLDEFEKAHPRVWDLFLQVFDDARLTDAQGNLADFRHSIIILTTNLGAVEHQGGSLGFTLAGGAFSEAQVLRIIGNTFRPEFVNRIDRVVVFRPLSRTVMRDILRKELGAVLQRRGFRNREWAVEWEESAIDFLLERGFTRDMGARPLRRAIDQHVLAPIAMTIVEHRFPQGDQFLFVRSEGGGIEVEFVDPDAPPGATPPAAPSPLGVAPGALSYAPLILTPSGGASEREFLQAALADLEARLQSERWVNEKQHLLQEMGRPGFWSSAERYVVLGQIEHRDSIEAGAATVQSLMRRLTPRAGRGGVPPSILSNVAQQLYLLQHALADLDRGLWPEVFVAVEAVAGDPRGKALDGEWSATLCGMYREWARKRRMRASLLEGADASEFVLSIAGFGAHGILLRETGLHLFETPDAQGGFDRQTARVRVAPQPARPRPPQQSELAQALACLAAGGPPTTAIVRRYRAQPSPLVRDAVAGWRTGRLDQVLGGDFDLIT
jgi:ATP-dependent Clp protease ATP-binding subunit ClpC